MLNSSDILGGAARAAYRIHEGLRDMGITSRMLVQYKTSGDNTVIGPTNKLKKGLTLLRPTFDSAMINLFARGSKDKFSPAWLPFSNIPSQVNLISPDIVHFHWLCDGMLSIEKFKQINKPIVWTLHDMWAFTGGCHYNDGCERFQQACGNCPQLVMRGNNDLSYRVMKRKRKAWSQLDITFVTPSSWLADRAKESSLLKGRRIEIIHNGLDLNLFKPSDKTTARRIWNLPINKKLILFGAMNSAGDYRKGFDLVYEALKHLKDRWPEKAQLVIFGSNEPENPPNFGLPVRYLGQLHDDVSLALLYSSADITVIPSRQDNLPNTAVESISCGTPVVAFNVTGLRDIVDHRINGYLAKPFDVSSLSYGIDWILSDENRHKEICKKAREKAVNCFDIKKITKMYAALYDDVINFKIRK